MYLYFLDWGGNSTVEPPNPPNPNPPNPNPPNPNPPNPNPNSTETGGTI